MSKFLRLFGAVMVAVLMVPTAAFAEEPPEPLWGDESDAVIDLVENQDDPSTGGLTEAAQYGWEPLGIVAGGSQIRRHSLGRDVWEVWLCNTGSTGYNYGAKGLTKKLNQGLKPYFKWLSEGKYDLSFVVGGTVNETHDVVGWPCLDKVANRSDGNRNGVVLVFDQLLSSVAGYLGYAGPGRFCPDAGSCSHVPDTYPANDRYAVLGAETFTSDWNRAEPLTSVAAHEMGHAIHFPHSSSSGGYAYDNPIDVMSGNNTLFDGSVSSRTADPYATLGFNRYAAGWIPSSDVVVFDGGVRKVKLVKPNHAGKQLVVIRLAKGRYLTIDARLRATYDPIPNSISGAAVHIVDQRPICPEADGWGMTACFGILRTHVQKPANPYGAKHVLRNGQERNVAGYNIEVLGKGANWVKVKITEN